MAVGFLVKKTIQIIPVTFVRVFFSYSINYISILLIYLCTISILLCIAYLLSYQ
jgi:hypothetical protein